MNIKERINFYLGYNLINKKNIESDDNLININNLLNCSIYDDNLRRLLIKTNNADKCFKFAYGDIENIHDSITLVKNRCEGNDDSVILRCLNFNRHWEPYYNKPSDIKFELKKNCIFWRGTTTGQINRKGNRFDLVSRWFNIHENIDVGFSLICQEKDNYTKYVKGECDMSTFLTYKYIISVEGNDKDSGLQWKLNSNSLILMPKPRVTTWLMETTLIPNYHYLLLEDDFSDLEEKLNWCNNNQDKCIEIIKHANTFMSQFSDNELEEQLEIDVINKYFEIIKSKNIT
jgi:hypothetical protein